MTSTIGLLLSGGLDSCIMLSHFLQQGLKVQPIYVNCHLTWQTAELASLQKYLAAMKQPNLAALVQLDQPVADLYGNHWSVTGKAVPDESTTDDAVYLPGRNVLLAVKSVLWCQMHGVDTLALATLRSNPFPDATDEFFDTLTTALNLATQSSVQIIRPFQTFDKLAVMQLGQDAALQYTFSCISPAGELHCGRCNKCAERQAAFRSAGLPDPTTYAAPAPARMQSA